MPQKHPFKQFLVWAGETENLWKISWFLVNVTRYIETFSALLALCAGNSPVTGEFPSRIPVTRSFGIFFDLRLNKRLSKRGAGDLRRHRAHYDVTVMVFHVSDVTPRELLVHLPIE